jgi:uncharacterized protein (TIGR03435 family)
MYWGPCSVRKLAGHLACPLISVVVLSLEIGSRAIDVIAQAPSQQDFEVASIRRSEPGNLRGSTFEFLPGGVLRIANGTLRAILETAYDVREFQILGGPGWVNSEQYDILARSADSLSNEAGATNDVKAVRLRLQALLRQRFNLEVHRETRELPEYALEVAKKGPKLIQDDASNGSNNARTGIQRSCGQMIGTNTTVANLSLMLARQLDRPVLDRTGLTGKYNFQFAWTPDTGPCSGSPESSNAPSIFTALEDTLGLRLESMKGPVDTLIIDRAERPSEN